MAKKALIVALLLGFLTSAVIGLAETYLPNTAAKGIVIDTLAFPGAATASLYYSEGVYRGRGAPAWGLAVIILNFFLYVFLWLVVLAAVASFGRHDRNHKGTSPVRRNGT
jgi:hypothetical protein